MPVVPIVPVRYSRGPDPESSWSTSTTVPPSAAMRGAKPVPYCFAGGSQVTCAEAAIVMQARAARPRIMLRTFRRFRRVVEGFGASVMVKALVEELWLDGALAIAFFISVLPLSFWERLCRIPFSGRDSGRGA